MAVKDRIYLATPDKTATFYFTHWPTVAADGAAGRRLR
jgi:hypothetical protein